MLSWKVRKSIYVDAWIKSTNHWSASKPLCHKILRSDEKDCQGRLGNDHRISTFIAEFLLGMSRGNSFDQQSGNQGWFEASLRSSQQSQRRQPFHYCAGQENVTIEAIMSGTLWRMCSARNLRLTRRVASTLTTSRRTISSWRTSVPCTIGPPSRPTSRWPTWWPLRLLGIDSCPIEGFNKANVEKYLSE